MAAPGIDLPKPYVLLTNANSSLGILPLDASLSFGIIALVYGTSNWLQAGDSVMYQPKEGKRVMYGSTIYIMISDEFVSGREVIPP